LRSGSALAIPFFARLNESSVSLVLLLQRKIKAATEEKSQLKPKEVINGVAGGQSKGVTRHPKFPDSEIFGPALVVTPERRAEILNKILRFPSEGAPQRNVSAPTTLRLEASAPPKLSRALSEPAQAETNSLLAAAGGSLAVARALPPASIALTPSPRTREVSTGTPLLSPGINLGTHVPENKTIVMAKSSPSVEDDKVFPTKRRLTEAEAIVSPKTVEELKEQVYALINVSKGEILGPFLLLLIKVQVP